MIYVSSNTDLQTIDTFELSLVHSVDYVIHMSNSEDNQISYLNITHDGVTTGELQESVVYSNGPSLEFTTDVNLYECRLRVAPSKANTTFVIEKTVRECNLFSESTKSGKLIFANSGVGIDWESSLNNITIRQDDHNFYGDPSIYYISNKLGYVPVKNELLTDEWISYNGSDIEKGDFYIATSSGQNPNFQYQEIQIEAGYSYRISANAFYQIADDVVVKEGTQRQQGQCFIKIGKSPGSSEYINKNLSESEESLDLMFDPDDTFYVSFGFGDRSNKAILKNPSVKQIGPVQSWNKDNGSFYIKWETAPLNDSIIDIGPINISIDSGGNVTLNDAVIGVQSATNRLALTYDLNEIRTSLNGNSVQINASQNMDLMYQFDFDYQPLKFSYFPVLLSNSGLIEVSTSG